MPIVVVTLQVEDSAKWETGFRTHADLFKSQTVTKPIRYAINEGNQIVLTFEPENVDTYLKALDSPATAEAMAFDGVKRETVKVTVLDKTFDL
jgi:hypothetical protein